MKKYFLYLFLLNFLSLKAQKELDSLTANAEWRKNYDYISQFNQDLAMVHQNSMYGYVNKYGQIVIPLKYTTISEIKNGYISVSDSSRKDGIINIKGKTVVDFKYDFILLEEDGKHFLASRNNKMAYLTISEKEIIPYKYYSILPLGKDFFTVAMEENGKKGVMNKKGEFVIPMEYDGIETGPFLTGKTDNRTDILFPNGKIFKNASGKLIYEDFKDIIIVTTEDKKVGLYDKYGNELLPCKYEGYRFILGNLLLKLDGKYGVVKRNKMSKTIHKYDNLEYCGQNSIYAKVNKKWGVIKENEDVIIPFLYDSLFYRSDTVLIAMNYKKQGLISMINQILLPLEYDSVFPISFDGKGYYYIEKDNKIACINNLFNIIIPFDEGKISIVFKVGKFWYCLRNGLLGGSDENGKIVLPYKYKFNLSYYTDYTKDSLSIVSDEKNNTKVILDLKNAKVLTKEYQDINKFYDAITVKENGKYAFADFKTFAPISPFEYEKIELSKRRGPLFFIKNDSLMTIEDPNPSLYFVKKDGFWGIVDSNNTPKTKLIYDTIYVKYENAYVSDKHNIVGYKNNEKIIFTKDLKAFFTINKNQSYASCLDSFIITSNNNSRSNYGVFGVNNKVVVPFVYDKIESTDIGFRVKKGDKSGFYNFNGKKIVDAIFSYIDVGKRFLKVPFEIMGQTNYGLLDSRGDTILPFKYSEIKIYDSIIVANLRKYETPESKEHERESNNPSAMTYPLTESPVKYGIFNFDKEQITPFIYAEVRQENKDFLIVVDKNFKHGVLNLKGENIIPFEYQNIHSISKNGKYIIAKQNWFYGIIDFNNKVVASFIYDIGFAIFWIRQYLSYSEKREMGYIKYF